MIHKTTTMLARTKPILVVERFRPENMLKNHHLAKSLADASFGEFVQQLDYKCRRYGSRLVKADPFYPSTKRCSGRGRVRGEMPLREISRVSGISISSLYYKQKVRRVSRLSPLIEQEIVRTASERPTYGYRRVWAVLRNNGTRVNRKAVRRVLRDGNLSLPYAKHRGRTKTRNLFRPTGPDQLWETDITYIPTEQGMTYLMATKDCFTKEWHL